MSPGEIAYGLPLVFDKETLGNNFNYTEKELIYSNLPSLMYTLSIALNSDGLPNVCLENYSPLSTLILFFNLIMNKFVIKGLGSGFFVMLSYLIDSVFLRVLIHKRDN